MIVRPHPRRQPNQLLSSTTVPVVDTTSTVTVTAGIAVTVEIAETGVIVETGGDGIMAVAAADIAGVRCHAGILLPVKAATDLLRILMFLPKR